MTVFLDTNLLVYLADDSQPDKRDRAASAIAGCQHRPWISTQVLIELHNVLIRKLGFDRSEATAVLESNSFAVQSTDAQLVYRAAETAATHQLSIFDAMIIEAAAAAGCTELWTEDLATGSTLRGVKIVNPLAD